MSVKEEKGNLGKFGVKVHEDDWIRYCKLWNKQSKDRSQKNIMDSKNADSMDIAKNGEKTKGGENNLEASIPMKGVVLPISDIQYTTSTIPCCFRHSSNEFCIRLEDTMRDLMRNRKVLQKMPKLYVMKHGEQYWAVGGNRRLYVYKSLAMIGYLDHLNVIEVPFLQEWFSKCSRSHDVVVAACNTTNCAENLCKKIYFEEKKRREQGCYLCFWLTAIFMVLIAIAVGSLLVVNRFPTCPGLEICEQLSIIEFFTLKWRGVTGNSE